MRPRRRSPSAWSTAPPGSPRWRRRRRPTRPTTPGASASRRSRPRSQRLDAERASELEVELASLSAERDGAAARVAELQAGLEARAAAAAQADEACEVARGALRAAERSAEQARRESARVGAELAAANQYLRSHAGAPRGARALTDDLEVQAGLELAVAAALGGRLRAAIVQDLAAGEALLSELGADGGHALVGGLAGAEPASGEPPAPGARRLADAVRGDAGARRLGRARAPAARRRVGRRRPRKRP